jgi:hypothetical protein
MKDSALIIAAEPADSGKTFKLPEGVDIGDAKPGDTIERVVAFKLGDGNRVTIESIEGIPLDGEDSTDMRDRSEPEEEMSETDLIGNIKKSIGVPAGS